MVKMRFFAVIIYSSVCFSVSHAVDLHGFQRNVANGIYAGNLKWHNSSYLNVTPITNIFVKKTTRCVIQCLKTESCFSFNIASKATAKGFLCQPLPTDKYNASANFTTSTPLFSHYSFSTWCSRFPCQHGSKCVPNYIGGTYTCVCINEYVGIHCENVATRLVSSPPSSMNRTSPRDLQIPCNATGIPAPTITWTRTGGSLPLGRSVIGPFGLLIQNTTAGDDGEYVCNASNTVNFAVARTNVTIYVRPFFYTTPPSTRIEKQLQGPIILQYKKEGKPNPILTWRRLSGLPLASGRVSFNTTHLQIVSPVYEDSDSYICLINNTIGSIETSTLIFIEGGFKYSQIIGNNSTYSSTLLGYLAPVTTNVSRWVKCWRAQHDGWNAKIFHSRCDDKGPTVTIARVGDNVFGGYTDSSWALGRGGCRYISSSKPFLFSLSSPVKLPFLVDGRAMYVCHNYGPTFGSGHDLYIAATGVGCSSTCRSFAAPPGCSGGRQCSYFAGTPTFTVNEVEVFFEFDDQ